MYIVKVEDIKLLKVVKWKPEVEITYNFRNNCLCNKMVAEIHVNKGKIAR